jgi:hypothetical protein
VVSIEILQYRLEVNCTSTPTKFMTTMKWTTQEHFSNDSRRELTEERGMIIAGSEGLVSTHSMGSSN